MTNLNEIISKITQVKPVLADKYHLTEIGIFGSYVRGEQTLQSDVDILVDFSRGMSLFKFVRLSEELKILLGTKVDLVMKSALKPYIGKQILKEVRIV